MFFPTQFQANQYCKSQQSDIPALRGRLKVIADTRTVWCRKTGNPVKQSGFTVIIASC